MNDGPPKKTNDAVSVVRGSSVAGVAVRLQQQHSHLLCARPGGASPVCHGDFDRKGFRQDRSEEHTSELQSQFHLVCRLLLEKKKKKSRHFPSRKPTATDDRCGA